MVESSSYNIMSDLNHDLPRLPLTFLDPDFYCGPQPKSDSVTPITQGAIDLEGEYICVVCCGVVLDPLECKQCSSLYCKGCLPRSDLPCPKRCGGQDYGKVNRFIMNALNKLPFRCQFSPKCEKTIPYEQYMQHYAECEEGKPKECENAEC